MPNKLISMSKVRSLLRLYTEGVSKNAIAERLGLPRNTVKKYIRLFLACDSTLEELEAMSDGALEQIFLDMVPRKEMEDDPKHSALLSFFPEMAKALKHSGVNKEQEWCRYRELILTPYKLHIFFKEFRISGLEALYHIISLRISSFQLPAE
jgi:predicted transcriptional regulator